MSASLRTLLTNRRLRRPVPPARLPLDQAIRDYARYRQEADAWMLGRFVIPAARLNELAPYHKELFSAGQPFAFTVLSLDGFGIRSAVHRGLPRSAWRAGKSGRDGVARAGRNRRRGNGTANWPARWVCMLFCEGAGGRLGQLGEDCERKGNRSD